MEHPRELGRPCRLRGRGVPDAAAHRPSPGADVARHLGLLLVDRQLLHAGAGRGRFVRQSLHREVPRVGRCRGAVQNRIVGQPHSNGGVVPRRRDHDHPGDRAAEPVRRPTGRRCGDGSLGHRPAWPLHRVPAVLQRLGGVLTGCHRWDLHNGLNAGTYGTIVIGMITTLILGGGLPAISAVYLTGTVAGELMRMRLAYRVCPELKVQPKLATASDIRMLFSFGGKTIVDSMSRLLLAQANSILVASHLGPAALAVYARPGALVRHADTITNKSSLLLSPAASSLKISERHDEVKKLFIEATRMSAFAAMSVTVFLSVMGDPILQTWMGPRYREGTLMAVIAIGNFLPLTQRPAQQVLIGLNRHGRIGWASLAVALLGVAAVDHRARQPGGRSRHRGVGTRHPPLDRQRPVRHDLCLPRRWRPAEREPEARVSAGAAVRGSIRRRVAGRSHGVCRIPAAGAPCGCRDVWRRPRAPLLALLDARSDPAEGTQQGAPDRRLQEGIVSGPEFA